MGNSSGKESGQGSNISPKQRDKFEEQYEASKSSIPVTKGKIHPIFGDFPKLLGEALTQYLLEKTKGEGESAQKKELLNILGLAISLELSGLVVALLSFGKFSLEDFTKQVAHRYLEIWGASLSQSQPGTLGLRDYLLTSHWRPNELDVEDQDVDDWLKYCQKKSFDADKLEDWCVKNRQFMTIFSEVFKDALLGHDSVELDFVAPLVNGGTMDAALCWLIMKYVPIDCHKTWNLLYTSKKHGASWNAFQRAVTRAGPTIIVVKEKVTSGTAHTFGAFSYVNWACHPKFFGDGQSFLFTSQPHLKAYPPTSYNLNYQYLNHGAQTLPNGLGLGGQLEYFGLWIDNSFEWGASNANPKCSTYNSPCLSQNSRFLIDDVEVWCLKPPEEEDLENKASILDRNPEAAALLEMANRPMYSQGLREPISDDDD